MKNKNITKKFLATIMVAGLSVPMLAGCGASDTVADQKEAPDVIDEQIDSTVETSFGLQDYAGFYCMTTTEQIEDYEVTYTTGYLLNPDGTGVSYGQDVVDITWNETEIHYADSTESFVMEPGKLTVRDVVYNKIDGTLITPNPYYVDMDNVEDGTYHVYIDKNGINELDEGLTIRAEIYTEDTYDTVDINNMTEGDVIYINGSLLPVNSITQTDSGFLEINGGLENGGSSMGVDDESNCYVYVGMDVQRSYTLQGVADLAVSENVKLIDSYDPTEDKEYTGNEAVSVLKTIVEENPLTDYDGSITVENGVIVEIHRLYVP